MGVLSGSHRVAAAVRDGAAIVAALNVGAGFLLVLAWLVYSIVSWPFLTGG